MMSGHAASSYSWHHEDIFLLSRMITDWSGLTPLAIAQMSECSVRFLRPAQRGPWVCLYTFCWRRRRWRASMFLMWLLGMRRVTPSFQIFLWEEAVLEKPGAMLRMTATLWAGMRWGTPFPGQVVGLCNILTRFRVSRSMSFWPWNWKYKAGLFLKFPGLFLKFPGLILKCPGIKGWPQHRREKGIELELSVGSICLPLARGVGAPRCRVSCFEIGPATSHSCFPVVAASGLNRICS